MSKPSESDIAKHAYHLWEREGRPHGRDKEHWHTAEREILGAATAKEDRPIGEIRSAQQASAQQTGAQKTSVQQTPDRQTGSASPGRPAHPASPGMTQAAAATSKRVSQAQGEQSGAQTAQTQAVQPAGSKPQQQSRSPKAEQPGAAKSEPPARKPRAGSRQNSP